MIETTNYNYLSSKIPNSARGRSGGRSGGYTTSVVDNPQGNTPKKTGVAQKVAGNSALQKALGLGQATAKFTQPSLKKESTLSNKATITARDEISLNNLEQRIATQVQNGEISPEEADRIQRGIDTNRGVLNSDWQDYLRNRSY